MSTAMGWQVVETHVDAKNDDQPSEDLIVCTDTWIAVIDGATDKHDHSWYWRGTLCSSGLLAASVVAATFETLPAHTDAAGAVDCLRHALGSAVRAQQPGLDASQWPSASVTACNLVTDTAWRVGDGTIRIDRAVHRRRLEIDEIAGRMRAAVHATYRNIPHEGDPGRDAIDGLLKRQGLLANQEGPFGYGTINGQSVPTAFIDTWDISDAHEIVITSDGYPTADSTLEHAEANLARLLAEDPLCVGVLQGTKGKPAHARSFDDRAWVRLVRGRPR